MAAKSFYDLDPSVMESTSAWMQPDLLNSDFAALARRAFWNNQPIPHLCLDDLLLPGCAAAIESALQSATYIRHPHDAYQIEIAPRAKQQDSALTAFMDWLGSEHGTRWHTWLLGWCQNTAEAVRVQAACYKPGDGLPCHVDEEGLAVVYGFSRDWLPQYGGVLSCYYPESGVESLRIQPSFNTAFFFRTKAAPHAVSTVTEAAGFWRRRTITAVYPTADL